MNTLIKHIKHALEFSVSLPGERALARGIRTLPLVSRVIFGIFAAGLIVSALWMVNQVNNNFMTTVPAEGGEVVEGVTGSPRFINPLLASSDTDRDLTTLIYSGLLRATETGRLVPDLAKEYTVSEDGLVYTFTLKDNLTWHDGAPLTANDVIFTIERAQNPALRSPKRASWDGVAVERIDEKTVQFTLDQPYSPFQENATLGILPEHIWGTVSVDQITLSKFNTEPIGSGPYQFTRKKEDNGGIPIYYDLKPFENFALGKPYIESIRMRFYSEEQALLEALDSGEIESVNSISPESAQALAADGYRVERVALPRVFGVFFNQNEANIFTEKAVRRALTTAIDRDEIIEDVLFGYGTPLDGPIPPGVLGYKEVEYDDQTPQEHIDDAREILQDNGWELDEEAGIMVDSTSGEQLSFSLATSDVAELKQTAQAIKTAWEAIGAEVDLNIFAAGDLTQNIIRPRKYDAVLFGEIIGRDSDPFAFWHSSQRLDPGLNIALYTNITVDDALEEARATTNIDKRQEWYRVFQEEVAADIPAVFIYAPEFIYILPEHIKGLDLGPLTTPSERFLNVYNWHINTDHVWEVFQGAAIHAPLQ